MIVTPDELHRLLGHLPVEAARKLVNNEFVEGIEIDETAPTSEKDCVSCLHDSMTRKAISKPAECEAKGAIGDEIHTDVWGPASVETPQHKKYYVSFTDETSRYTVVVLMHAKSGTFDAFKALIARWERESGLKIKMLHSDNGGEYKSKDFDNYLAANGIQRRLTVHDTPEHNGVAEGLNRTLLEKVRAMLHAADLPGNLWGESMQSGSRSAPRRKLLVGKHHMKCFTTINPTCGTSKNGDARCGYTQALGN